MDKVLGKKQIFSLISLLLLTLVLPFLVVIVQQTIKYLSQAQGTPANLMIDTQAVLGPMPRLWEALAQGGEEEGRMFKSVIPQLRELSPRHIRIDHVLNRYGVVSRQSDGGLTFDFSTLDQTINDILSCGALPFFSLSYVPEALSTDGSPISPPKNWQEWSLVVEKFVEHYSGKDQKNLTGVYYEVFNEPDLFGKWKISGEPNYLNLYRFSAEGAQRAKNTNQFFLGGPATTNAYPNWIKGLLKFASDYNLKLDFLSWHRYSSDPRLFAEDVREVNSIMASFPQFANLQKIITEFGFNSENNPAHDNNVSAAHLAAVVRELVGKVDLAFTFEARDGPDPTGKEYWGRWGVLTHQGEKKPRFFAFSFLNQMGRHQLKTWGEGSWVKAIGSKELNKIKVLIVNYDPLDAYSETVPVTFLNLEKGIYRFSQKTLSGETFTTNEAVTGGSLEKMIFLSSNEVVFVELERTSL